MENPFQDDALHCANNERPLEEKSMNAPSNADINARLEQLESTVAGLAKAQSDPVLHEQLKQAMAARAARASARSAAERTAPDLKLPRQTNAGSQSKLRRAIAAVWGVLEEMSG
ncbi:hypothetical protein [Dyella sp.]|uniref:hypothetical protein n=1 Tax=Dyella sp. TaxID=1869338 RepID=UPI00283F9F36|nr:hypothetical protein [Dyella sp.]MDR3443711.1 hypothetical protein [Dyella sp.]